jgi:hypothetical protein
VSAVFIGVVTAGLVAPLVSNVRGPAPAAARTTFIGLDGGTVSGTSPDARATVAIFLSTQCPMANRYGPRIVALEKAFGPRGFRFLAVYPNNRETDAEVKKSATARGYTFGVVRDPGATVARAVGAVATPEVAVFAANGKTLYKGPIDDNPFVSTSGKPYLARALTAILAGNPAPKPGKYVPGCRIEEPAKVTSVAVTYANQVQPILRANCEPCHHANGPAPFTLANYKQARSWAKMAKIVTQDGRMPPWKPAANFGHFDGERRLTNAQIATLAKWADAGAPLGDAQKVLPPQSFPNGWMLGEPEQTIQPDTTYHLAAEGDDVYRCYSVDPSVSEDRWLSGLEVRPGNMAVVHHVIVFLDKRGVSKAMDDADPEPGYHSSGGGVGFLDAEFVGGWAPGNYPRLVPDGMGIRIPKGSRLVIQVHYHKNGQAESDLTRIGLHWAKAPVDKPIHVAPILNAGFKLPPGKKDIPVHAEMTAPADVHLLGVLPHMHNRGSSIQSTAVRPDGSTEPLIKIADWDFNWQDSYFYKQPIALPKGSKINLEATYDNSADNPKNPDPTAEVGWGEQTNDEMCLMFAIYTIDGEHLLTARAPAE